MPGKSIGQFALGKRPVWEEEAFVDCFYDGIIPLPKRPESKDELEKKKKKKKNGAQARYTLHMCMHVCVCMSVYAALTTR
jgi:hypothetical protein